MLAVIKNLKVGEYSQPTEFADERGKKGIRIVYLISQSQRIVYLISQSQPHRENLKDDYSKIANRALEEKKENALEEWFYKKIKTYYVMIDKDYQTCPEIAKWVDASKISDTGKK